MRRSRPFRRVDIVVAGAAVLFFLGAAGVSRAQVAGSRHDFTGGLPYGQNVPSLNKGGVCTPCHTPHYSPAIPAGWPRSMTDEVLFYEQVGSLSEANYLPGTTLLCYDCHDDNVSADNDPANTIFTNPPQDIARGGGGVGYYENACGQLPEGVNPAPTDGSPTGGHYWKSEPSLTPDFKRGDKIACSLCHDPHKVATGTNEAFIRTTTWDGSAMKPLNDFNSYGTDLKASTYNATTLPNGSRRGTGNGRDMCAICHGYSDAGNQASLYNVTVPKPPGGVPEHVIDNNAGATACVACHGHNQIAGCNACHGYPPMLTESEGGGTFNPNDSTKPLRRYVENYPGGAGAHRRHRDALAAIGSSIFACELCHGPNPGRPGTTWHNQGSGATCGTVTQANVDIMGLTSYWGAGSSYNGVASGGFTDPVTGGVFAFTAKGGVAQRCADLTCHGNPPDAAADADALNWDDKMVYDTTDANAGNWIAPAGDSPKICKWCHDATPARIGTSGVWAPNVLGDGSDDGTGVWATGTWGADVSGHGKATGSHDDNALNDGLGKAAANKTCTVCHDARYTTNPIPDPPLAYVANTPLKTHFDNAYETSGSEKRLRDSINGLPVASTDAACGTCHQDGTNGVGQGAEVSTHGNTVTPGGFQDPAEGQFTRVCRQCHDVHGSNWNGASRNLRMIGKWLDAVPPSGTRGTADPGEVAVVDSSDTSASPPTNITTADAPVIFTATSGANSYDDGFGGGGEAPAQHESVCVVCHADLVSNHSEATSPDVFGTGHNPTGVDCMQCHDHDYDNNPATVDAFMPSGCNGCHGTNASEALLPNPCGTSLPGQFWPDGDSPFAQYDYSDNQTGAHCKHIEAIAFQVYGETLAQVVQDYQGPNPGLTASEKQKTICAFCHPNPGGPGHSTDDGAAPSGAGRVNVYAGTGAGDWLRKYTPNAGPTPPANRATYADDTTAPPNGYVYNASETIGGTCSSLVCHNQAATPAAGWNTPPVWTQVVTIPPTTCSSTTCHAPATYTLAHPRHVGGGAGQKSFECFQCHADNGVNLQHGNGEVDMTWSNAGSLEATAPRVVANRGNGFYNKDGTTTPTAPSAGDTGFAYKSGGDTVADPTYAISCYLVYCHGGDNDNNVPTSIPDWGGSTTSPSSFWNSVGRLACTTCHATAPPTGRHTAHDTNNAWVPNECGTCHLANAAPGAPAAGSMDLFPITHVNGSVDMAATVTYTPPNCTNVCHLVGPAVPPVSADPGDWLDANPLACTDCHSATYIGTAPTSGLHAVTTAMAHDSQFMATAGETPETATCTHCHLSTGPSASHKTGPDNTATPENSTVAVYSFNTTYIPNVPAGSGYVNTGYPTATSCQALCHSDYRVSTATGSLDPGGLWRRTWVGVTDAKPLDTNLPGDQVCDNCHGDGTGAVMSTWNWDEANDSTTDHTDPFASTNVGDWVQVKHGVCTTCHGWGQAAYTITWGTAPGHGDGSITMNGPDITHGTEAGAEYNDTTGGCAAACHSSAWVLKTNSGWPANYGDFGSGACGDCHNGVQTTYPLAPNVMGDGTDPDGVGTTPKPYDDGTWGFNVNGHGANGTAPNTPQVMTDPGDPGPPYVPPTYAGALSPNAVCIDCHELQSHHLDGYLDGVSGRSNATRYENNYHLKTDGTYPFVPTSAAAEYTVQRTFDNACFRRCHFGETPPMWDAVKAPFGMRHAKDSIPAALVVRFGDKGTEPDGENLTYPVGSHPIYPVDSDLSTLAATGGDDFVPCASCHGAHGTDVTVSGKSTNRMSRDVFGEQGSTLCLACH